MLATVPNTGVTEMSKNGREFKKNRKETNGKCNEKRFKLIINAMIYY